VLIREDNDDDDGSYSDKHLICSDCFISVVSNCLPVSYSA